jgi:hypothetical protein
MINNIKHKYKINKIEGKGDTKEILKKFIKDTAILELKELEK